MTRRIRLDVWLVEHGLVETRSKAQALIMAGQVWVGENKVDKAGTLVGEDANVRLADRGPTFVSRGGDKLQGALVSFAPHGLAVEGWVAADLGASTGGFTDCLIQHGVARVHAVDVGHGLLHERLRKDARVRVHERINARYLTAEQLGEQVDLVVVDASFIGLGKLLEAIRSILKPDGRLVALIKPQFEAGKREVSRGHGVIRDPIARARIVEQVAKQVSECGFEVLADAPCVIAGPKGNLEHFVYARPNADPCTPSITTEIST